MAKASASEVTLTLSIEEARTLLYLCNNIGGDPDVSARGYIDAIGSALMSAGVIAPNSASNLLHNGDFFFVANSGLAIRGAA